MRCCWPRALAAAGEEQSRDCPGRSVGLALLLLARIAANIIAFAPDRDDFRDFVAVMEKVPSNAIVGAASPPEGRGAQHAHPAL